MSNQDEIAAQVAHEPDREAEGAKSVEQYENTRHTPPPLSTINHGESDNKEQQVAKVVDFRDSSTPEQTLQIEASTPTTTPRPYRQFIIISKRTVTVS